jgi:hypothetical protein
MNNRDEQDPVSATLSDWRIQPSRDPQFRTQVWNRIAAANGNATWAGYVRAHTGAIAAGLAAAVVVGAFSGRGQARAQIAAERDHLATVYVQALDARTMKMP